MSDVSSRFVNAYIETSVGMINEYVTKHIQLQSQLKVANELLAERETILKNMAAEIEQLRGESAKVNPDEFAAMKNKLTHMDAIMQQMGQMKTIIKEKDEEIGNLKNHLSQIDVDSMKEKLSRMDNLMQQMGHLNIQVRERDELIKIKDDEINLLKNTITELSTKPVINKRKKDKQAENTSILPVPETVNEF